MFKIGDKVEAIQSSGGESIKKGDLFTVTAINNDWVVFIDKHGNSDGWNAKYLKLHTEASQVKPEVQYYRVKQIDGTYRIKSNGAE